MVGVWETKKAIIAYFFRWKIVFGRLVTEVVAVWVAVARIQLDNDAVLGRSFQMGRDPALHDV